MELQKGNPEDAERILVPTPVGAYSLIVAEGKVLAGGWDGDLSSQLALIHPNLRPIRIHEAPEDGHLIAQRIHAFFAGDVSAIQGVPILQNGGPFTQQVWAVMHEIPAGETVSYAELAAMAGNPMAYRAAATACARNPIALFVPCHRITASGGKAGGYRYGLHIKEALLAIERDATRIHS